LKVIDELFIILLLHKSAIFGKRNWGMEVEAKKQLP